MRTGDSLRWLLLAVMCLPSVSLAIITPPLNVKPKTEVPVTKGVLQKVVQVTRLYAPTTT